MEKLKAELVRILKTSAEPKSVESEADLILFHVARKQFPPLQKISDLYFFYESGKISFDDDTENEAMQIAEHRALGTPLQHLLAHQFFLNHDYFVNEAVLIPRFETEILVQSAIEKISERFSPQQTFRFAELGLGSGNISSEILSHFLFAEGIASEVSETAIEIAKKNLENVLGTQWSNRLKIKEVPTKTTRFEAFLGSEKFDFIFSNPPYVSRNDEIETEVLDHEPHLALFPVLKNKEQENEITELPNIFYENFVQNAAQLLKPGGFAFFEVPHERAEILLHLFQIPLFASAELIPDLTGRPRVLIAEMKRN